MNPEALNPKTPSLAVRKWTKKFGLGLRVLGLLGVA